MRSRHAAAEKAGAAAAAAEGRKQKRYGLGRGGVSVSPFCTESWGRMGDSAMAVMRQLAGQHARATGAQRSRTLQRWLAQLGVAMYRAMAETVAQACRPCLQDTQAAQVGTLFAVPDAADEGDLS